ncbi:MAG: hypothetical protein ABS76_01565 [Pelagibacterium sp. SCN 64-44]|nr:MAG: hypothetical protein ABS76_01565 [Pelagibacterium sp. SCN 64-44]
MDAIDRATAAADTVRNTFNVLGYGPTGGFEGSVELARGDNWVASLAATGAISQTALAAGDMAALSGRGTINIAAALAPNLSAGLGLGLGMTSQRSATLEDQAYHYSAEMILVSRIAPLLDLSGGASFELTSHNYTVGTGTGSGLGYLYSGNIGLSGKVLLRELVLTPSLNLEVSRETQAAIALSNGVVVPGFDRTGGKATVGGEISRTYYVEGASGFVAVTPRAGADVSLSLSHLAPDGGAQSTNWGLGVGVLAGLGMRFENGLGVDLSTRVKRAGETIGASVSGRISASF